MEEHREADTSVRLDVAEPYPNDEYRQLVRLPPKKIAALQVATGDVVKIVGDWETYAKVWRADREDWEDGIVRIPEYARVNCQAKIGEEVTIYPVGDAPKVESLTLQPYRGFSVSISDDAVDMIRDQLERTPSNIGQVHPLLTSDSTPSRRDIPLVVGAQSPEVGIISSETTISLSPAFCSED